MLEGHFLRPAKFDCMSYSLKVVVPLWTYQAQFMRL
jgi:hypothetical protein